MTEIAITWVDNDGMNLSGHCPTAPNALAIIIPALWGKVVLRIFSHGDLKLERQLPDVTAAKEAAAMAMRLLVIREGT